MMQTFNGPTPNGGNRMDIITNGPDVIINEYDGNNNLIYTTLGKKST